MNIETIKIPLSEASMIKDLLQLTSSQIYEKYGFMSDDTIAHSVKFKDGTEAVVRLVIYDNEDKPFTECAFTECVLYDKYGFVIAYSEPKNIYEGEWIMVTDEGEYKINVVAVNYVNLIYKGLCDGSIEVMQGFDGDAVCVIGNDWFHMHCELDDNEPKESVARMIADLISNPEINGVKKKEAEYCKNYLEHMEG